MLKFFIQGLTYVLFSIVLALLACVGLLYFLIRGLSVILARLEKPCKK